MRLWLRLTLAMAALAVVPVAVVGRLAVQATTEGAMVRPEEQLTREATTLSTFAASWSGSVGASLAGWYRVWSLDDRSADYQVGLLRAIYTAVDDVVTVGLVDDRLQPVAPLQWLDAAHLPERHEAGSPAREAALLAHLPMQLQAEVTFGAPYLPEGAAFPVVPVVVTREGSRLRLVAEVSLAPVARAFPADSDRAAAMFAGQGPPIVGSSPLLASSQVADVVALGLDLSFSPTDGSGELRGAAARVVGTDWLVVVVEPAARADLAVARLRRQTFLVVGVALAAVGAMGVLLHQQITVPVSRLRAVVGLIAGGGYDQRADLRRGDELGELAADLNHMAERLERGRAEILAQQAEIESFNAELQARVDARTAELRATQGSLVRASQYAAIAEVGAGLAHELNNPLAAILGLSQVLQVRARYDAAGLQRIEEQAQRCRDVVDTMVRFNSGELGPSRAGVVDLQRAAREAVDAQSEAYAQRGVRLEMGGASSTTPVNARLDPALASQILRRWLEVFRAGLGDGAALQVEVAWAAEQPAITFTPDRPLAPESTTHDDWRASGVQVWVARRLVDQSGGRVIEPEGSATAWRILLPVA